jgi:transcription regulator MmyB-like protein
MRPTRVVRTLAGRAARECAALLRTEAGRTPYDRDLSDLVGELSTQSEEFRSHWAAHNVRLHHKGEKRFNHPVVGEVELSFNRFELPAEPGLSIVAYTAEPGSRSADAFLVLASWAATEDAQRPPTATLRCTRPAPTRKKVALQNRADQPARGLFAATRTRPPLRSGARTRGIHRVGRPGWGAAPV